MREIDPDLKYCPQCDEEYIAEIENCAACEVPLITGLERLATEDARQRRLENRGVELSTDDDLVNIHRGPLTEIKHIENLLAPENINTLVAGDDNSCGAGCCTVFLLQVRREDAADAMTLMADDFRKRTGLDYHDNTHGDAVFNPEAAQAVCPACGHVFSTSDSTCPDCGLCLG